MWLIVATFLQWRHHGNEQQWEALRIPLLLSVTIGMLWNPISKQNEVLGLTIMILMWLGASLSLIKAPSNKWISQYPIGLYAGWLTAAIGVSLGTILFNRGIVADPWASIIGILTTSLLALFLLPKISDVTTFVISIVWGLIGILVNTVNNMEKDGSWTVLILASVVTVLLVVLGILHTKKQKFDSEEIIFLLHSSSSIPQDGT